MTSKGRSSKIFILPPQARKHEPECQCRGAACRAPGEGRVRGLNTSGPTRKYRYACVSPRDLSGLRPGVPRRFAQGDSWRPVPSPDQARQGAEHGRSAPAVGHGSPMRPARDKGRKGRNVWSPSKSKAEYPDAVERSIPFIAILLRHGTRNGAKPPSVWRPGTPAC